MLGRFLSQHRKDTIDNFFIGQDYIEKSCENKGFRLIRSIEYSEIISGYFDEAFCPFWQV